jgi:hypothetical protein
MEFNSGDCYDFVVAKNNLNLMSTTLKKCEFLLLIFYASNEDSKIQIVGINLI